MFIDLIRFVNFLRVYKKKLFFLPFLLCMAFFVGSLASFTSKPLSEITDQDVLNNTLQKKLTVSDYAKRLLILDKPATRIISLAPHITENIFSAGAGDLIVGAVSYSDYPAAAKKIPRVGNIQGFSIETIVALKPDLIIAWGTGHSANIVQKLIDLGLTVYIDEPKILEDVAKSIKDIAIMTGQQDLATLNIDKYLLQLSLLKQRYAKGKKISVLYQVWDKPLRTINGDHIISDVISLCGGQNSFADAAVIAPKISMESVLVRNPQTIVASGVGLERPDWLDDWLKWSSLSAVKEQNLFYIPSDLLQRHTVRILQGAEILCQQLEGVRNNHKAFKG
jgi:iron complex transport system substrate-binding protein